MENFDLSTTPKAEVTTEQHDNFIADLTTRKTAYCSMKADDEKSKSILFNAIQSPDFKVADQIGESISLSEVFVESITLTDEETGEVSTAPRTVLIASDGRAYVSVSKGIFNAVKMLFSVYGEPATWENPVNIKFMSINKGVRRIYTFKIC